MAKKLLVHSGMLRVAAYLRSPSAVILAYHSVRDDVGEYGNWIGPGITHTTDVFARHMELLARHFTPVTLDDILLFIKGEKRLPGRAVAVTFDDGYLDNLEVAAPVLGRFGISAAVYATVALVGSQDVPWFSRIRRAFMTTRCKTWRSAAHDGSWDITTPLGRDKALLFAYDSCANLTATAQIEAVRRIQSELEVDASLPPRRFMMNGDELRTLRKAGHIVGSHTLTHPNVAHVAGDDTLRSELMDSKRQLEGYLEGPVQHFSYPHPALHPQWTPRTVAATRLAGYSTAVTTTRGPVTRDSNPLALTRVHAPSLDHEFLWNLEKNFARGKRRPIPEAVPGEACS